MAFCEGNVCLLVFSTSLPIFQSRVANSVLIWLLPPDLCLLKENKGKEIKIINTFIFKYDYVRLNIIT